MTAESKGYHTAIGRWHRRLVHYVYILRCSDSSLYVGMTSNLDLRLLRHNEGVACGYTAKRRPVRLVHFEEFPSA